MPGSTAAIDANDTEPAEAASTPNPSRISTKLSWVMPAYHNAARR